MRAGAAVELAAVRRRFGATAVLAGIDLRLERGERVAVLGDNGAGKTTLLRIVAGILRASSGEVSVFGAPAGSPEARRRTGLLGHAPSLYAGLSALENLRFWGGLHGLRRPEARARPLLEQLGLDPEDRRPCSALSHGTRRRIGLARALLADPDLLVLDEPFAGLDAQAAEAVTDLVSQTGRTVICATHEAERAAAICRRMLELRAGRLLEAVPDT